MAAKILLALLKVASAAPIAKQSQFFSFSGFGGRLGE
jgi:hypothetical protein